MRIKGLRILPVVVLTTMLMAVVVTGCNDDDAMRTIPNQGNTPTMVTTGVDTYISDSGYIKYHAITDIWEMYDDSINPHWRFPRPLIVDIYEPGMKPGAHIECDSALYLTKQKLFRFDGHVFATNVNKDTFLTHQLYWDQAATEFYTDSFIHIVKADRILEGHGFRSNEKMTKYTILKPTAILPASEFAIGKKHEPDNEGNIPAPVAPRLNIDSINARNDSISAVVDSEDYQEFDLESRIMEKPDRRIPVPASRRNATENSIHAVDLEPPARP